jgi:hypothetical protein
MSQALKITDTNIKHAIAKSAEGYPLLGVAGYWSNTNFKDTQENVLRHVVALGLNPDSVPEVRGKSAFIRAVEEVAHTIKAKHIKVADNVAKCAYVIVQTVVDPNNLDATFTTETKAIFHKGTETLTVEGPNEAQIQALFEEYKTHYYSDQFRETVLKILTFHTDFMTIRDRGGVYFIPSHNNDIVDRLQRLFEAYPECQLDMIPVIDTGLAKKSVWKSLVGEVTAEIATLREDIAQLETDPSERSVRLRFEQYSKLKEKVANYEMLLQGTALNLKDDLDALADALKAKTL